MGKVSADRLFNGATFTRMLGPDFRLEVASRVRDEGIAWGESTKGRPDMGRWEMLPPGEMLPPQSPGAKNVPGDAWGSTVNYGRY